MSFFEFPHTRTYDSDLGWLLFAFKHLHIDVEHLKEWAAEHQPEYQELAEKVEGLVHNLVDVIVPWDSSIEYPIYSIVEYQGTNYIAVKPVPVGAMITNTEYWQPANTALEQINAIGVTVTDLIKHTLKAFDTAIKLEAAVDLSAGEIVQTHGFYNVADGGHSFYHIVEDDSDPLALETASGLYASPIPDGIGYNALALGLRNESTTAATLAALNAIIAKMANAVLIIPPEIDYGYTTASASRTAVQPDTDSAAGRLMILDYSHDATYGSGEADMSAYNGAQFRVWYHTPEEEIGQHDGNGFLVEGSYHPYIKISNNGDDVAKRASLLLCLKNKVVWQISQGVYTTDENFNITRFPSSGPQSVSFLIDRETGAIAFGANSNTARFGLYNREVSIFSPPGQTYLFVSDSATPSSRTWSLDHSYNPSLHEFNFAHTGTVMFGMRFQTQPLLRFRVGDKWLHISYETAKGMVITNVGATTEVMRTPFEVVGVHGISGGAYTTPNRPSGVSAGTMTFDTTLKKPIWYDGSRWVDANGTGV